MISRSGLLRSMVLAGVLAAAPAMTVQTAQAQIVQRDVVYVPTPQEVVDRMLAIAEVKSGDYMIDFGCGDGRMVVTAAKMGARGYGVDIDPERIKEANENAAKAGVTDRVEFKIANLFQEDLSKADVMAMYLLTELNLRLRPKILETMKPGTRIVSHAFDMGEWEADQRETVSNKQIFFWVVPARGVGGTWKVEGERPFTVELTQSFQMLSGKAEIDGKPATVTGRLRGADVTLTVDAGGGQPRQLTGKIEGNTITGAGWKATKS